jgi:hypothetical protein
MEEYLRLVEGGRRLVEPALVAQQLELALGQVGLVEEVAAAEVEVGLGLGQCQAGALEIACDPASVPQLG